MGFQYREYCCCGIPPRIIVAILSGIYFFAALAVAVFSWFLLDHKLFTIGDDSLEHLPDSKFNIALNTEQRTALGVVAGVYIASVIISFFGVIGAINHERRLMQIHIYLLLLQFTASIIAGAYHLGEIFSEDSCSFLSIFDSTDPNDSNTIDKIIGNCDSSLKTLRLVSCVWTAVTLLFQVWMLLCVNEYVKQLNKAVNESVTVGAAGAPIPILESRGQDALHYESDKQPGNSTPYTASVQHSAV